MKTPDLFPSAPVVPYVFVWIGKRGPAVKRFLSVETFDAYIIQVRTLMGDRSVDWRNPRLAYGVIA